MRLLSNLFAGWIVFLSIAAIAASGERVPVPSIALSPASVSLSGLKSQQFTATVSGSLLTAVEWSLSSPLGKISQTGLYQAPASIPTPTTLKVVATLKSNSKVMAQATVSLVPPPPLATPIFSLQSNSPTAGYTPTQLVNVSAQKVANATLWCMMDFPNPPPTQIAPCTGGTWQTRAPTSFNLSNFDGSHLVYLWASNSFGQVSAAPGIQSIVLDRSAPQARILNFTGGQVLAEGVAQFITWNASDANLGPNAIKLEYSVDGNWQLIADQLPNTGIYAWLAPDLVSSSLLIRVTATDLAGNSTASTPASALSAQASPLTLDCSLATGFCPGLSIQGDAADTSMFHGFGDPTIRRDPVTGTLWMAYSWPNTHVSGGVSTDTVDIHLSSSTDGGKTWNYEGPLWQSALTPNPTVSPARQDYSSHEVANILPVSWNGSTVWYAVHPSYLVQPGTYVYGEIFSTTTFVISEAPSPAQLADPGLPSEALGNNLTKMPIAQNLQALSPDLNPCLGFNEPALYAQNGTLYLFLQCMAANRPSGFYAVFSAPVGGDPSTLQWSYVGKFGGASDAAQLGAQYLVELDVSQRADGSLVVIATSAQETTSFGKQTDEHLGCKVVDFSMGDSTNPLPHFVASTTGTGFSVRASTTETDTNSGTNLGPGACAYEPTSSTGLLMVRKVIADPTNGYYWSLQSTGLMP